MSKLSGLRYVRSLSQCSALWSDGKGTRISVRFRFWYVTPCTLSVRRIYSFEWLDDLWLTMNWNLCGKKRSWPDQDTIPEFSWRDWGNPRNSLWLKVSVAETRTEDLANARIEVTTDPPSNMPLHWRWMQSFHTKCYVGTCMPNYRSLQSYWSEDSTGNFLQFWWSSSNLETVGFFPIEAINSADPCRISLFGVRSFLGLRRYIQMVQTWN